MINFEDFSFENAEMVYTVANTPSFIVRKLRNDPTVQKLSRQYPSSEIVSVIRECLQHKPNSARDSVLPFVLVSALALKNDWKAIDSLADAANENYRWFDLVLRAARSTVRPTSSIVVDGRPKIKPVLHARQTLNSTSTSILKLDFAK